MCETFPGIVRASRKPATEIVSNVDRTPYETQIIRRRRDSRRQRVVGHRLIEVAAMSVAATMTKHENDAKNVKGKQHTNILLVVVEKRCTNDGKFSIDFSLFC